MRYTSEAGLQRNTTMAFVMSQHGTWSNIFSPHQGLHSLERGEGSIIKFLKFVCSGRDNGNIADRTTQTFKPELIILPIPGFLLCSCVPCVHYWRIVYSKQKLWSHYLYNFFLSANCFSDTKVLYVTVLPIPSQTIQSILDILWIFRIYHVLIFRRDMRLELFIKWFILHVCLCKWQSWQHTQNPPSTKHRISYYPLSCPE